MEKLPNVMVVLDAIDGYTHKTALIEACCMLQIPIVTCGGAAGRIDPTKVVVDDLTRASECRLLFQCRKKLRDSGMFWKGPPNGKNKRDFKPRKWRILSVFSTEVQRFMGTNETLSLSPGCDGTLGTATFVTGTYGFAAAAHIVEMIVRNDLRPPKIKKIRKP